MQCHKNKEQRPFHHGGENNEFCPKRQRLHGGLERKVKFNCLYNGKEEHFTGKRINQDIDI